VCGDLEARLSWANNTIVRQGERRIGKSCGDLADELGNRVLPWIVKLAKYETWYFQVYL